MKTYHYVIITFITTSVLWFSLFYNDRSNYVIARNNITKQLDSLNIECGIAKVKIKELENTVVSLNIKKQKIKIAYKNKYEKINSYNTDSILNEFSRIFAKNNIH